MVNQEQEKKWYALAYYDNEGNPKTVKVRAINDEHAKTILLAYDDKAIITKVKRSTGP